MNPVYTLLIIATFATAVLLLIEQSLRVADNKQTAAPRDKRRADDLLQENSNERHCDAIPRFGDALPGTICRGRFLVHDETY